MTERKIEAEGGCGVIGIACEDKIGGRHLLPPLMQMCNRGNGKGGGIAASGLCAESLGITPSILANDYLLAIAYLDLTAQGELERDFIHPTFEITHIHKMSHIRDAALLPTQTPPEAILYFVRVKQKVREDFAKKHELLVDSLQRIDDEIVYQNSFNLNQAFYASQGEKRAFVLSHGKDLLVLKCVGYGDDVIRYYQLEDFKAHVWIGHHRYPTKGRVWHPGGAHPFIGLNEALVHNGDFANYFSMCEYLAARHITPLFLTDTEVAVLLFDLLYRTYNYPLEYVIEALAPTTERDFTLLPKEKQHIYDLLQKTHLHASPDGPWFFLIAQSFLSQEKVLSHRLLGITDTSMLRPQIFALQKGEASIGFAASEKQAIDAALLSLASEDKRFWGRADYYWNARGGSYTDGGAFVFNILPGDQATLVTTDKFGNSLYDHSLKPFYKETKEVHLPSPIPELTTQELFAWVKQKMLTWDYAEISSFLASLTDAKTAESQKRALDLITKLLDSIYPLTSVRRSCLLALLDKSLSNLVSTIAEHPTLYCESCSFSNPSETVVIDAKDFPSEGENSLSAHIVALQKRGCKKFIIINCRGQRFIACGIGAASCGVEIDLYGSTGDYLSSGIDGALVRVHGSAQDQVAQIMKEGTLVIYGDVGQTFMYGAKGGQAFVLGNAAGRPLINAVGKARAVINGTCLDYLAESFMAGDPLKDGGFVIVNGITLNEEGQIIELDTPYPGSNLFSLPSGGAIYIRDPAQKVTSDQLNGGYFAEMTEKDWEVILPYLEMNAQLFDIPVRSLLQKEDSESPFHQIYRKILPTKTPRQEEEAWVKQKT